MGEKYHRDIQMTFGNLIWRAKHWYNVGQTKECFALSQDAVFKMEMEMLYIINVNNFRNMKNSINFSILRGQCGPNVGQIYVGYILDHILSN